MPNIFSKILDSGKKHAGAILGVLLIMLLAAAPAMADPFVAPDIDTATILSCAGKAFAAIALFIAIGMGIKMFKKA